MKGFLLEQKKRKVVMRSDRKGDFSISLPFGEREECSGCKFSILFQTSSLLFRKYLHTLPFQTSSLLFGKYLHTLPFQTFFLLFGKYLHTFFNPSPLGERGRVRGK